MFSIDLAEASAELYSRGDESHEAVAEMGPMLVQGVGIETRYRFYQLHDFSGSVTVGGLAWRGEQSSHLAGATIEQTEKGVDLYAGASIGYDISEHWQTEIAYKRYFIDVNDVDNVSLKLIYLF